MSKHLLHLIASSPSGTIIQNDLQGNENQKMVYQKTAINKGNLGKVGARALQLRRHVIPADPKTTAQVQQRTKMPLAVSAWQGLGEETKKEWIIKANRTHLTGYQLFISQHMKGLI